MAEAAVAMAAVQAVGGIVQGIEANNAARAGARVDEENARLALLEGEQQALATRRDERRQAGDMLAALGGTGIQVGSGSAADVLAESAFQRETEIFNLRTRAAREAQGLNQAAADKRRAGRAAIVKSVFGVGVQALSAVSDAKRRNTMSDQWERERVTGRPQVPPINLSGQEGTPFWGGY